VAYLEDLDEIKKLYKDSKAESDIWRKDHPEYERLADNETLQDFLEDEYVAFPVLKHDDMMDCLSRIVDLEKKALIQKPSVIPAIAHSTKVNEGLRKLGQNQGGAEPWVTA